MTFKTAFSTLFLLAGVYSAGFAQLSVSFSGDTVQVTDKDVNWNCACTFSTNLTVSADSVLIAEVDTAKQWVKCLCYFTLTTRITGLAPGTYTAKVTRSAPFIPGSGLADGGMISFTVNSPGAVVFGKMSQSECHSGPQSVGEEAEVPGAYQLTNYPNPFNPGTVIRYQLSVAGQISVDLIDVNGRVLSTLEKEWKAPGDYALPLDGSGLATGEYFLRLSGPKGTEMRKIILVK